ncbi:MAG TPA: hypothetical protein VH591_02935 [Ktedonobacterales bacterium]|jgi:hypothetical protein
MARPLSGTPGTFGASSLPRWIAASVLLAGGALAFAATFLPLGYATYPADYGEIATTTFEIPAQNLITVIQFNLRSPGESSIIGTCAWMFLLWGAPLILAAAGLGLLLADRWRPRLRVWFVALIVALVGAGYVLVSCQFYVYPFFGLQGATAHTLTYGADLSFLGYLAALVGVIWLALQRNTTNSA